MSATSSTRPDCTITRAAEPEVELHARLIAAAQEAVRAALREHKRAGNAIAVWSDDGKVVWVPPEEIEA